MPQFFFALTLWLALVWLFQRLFKKSRVFSSPFIALLFFGILAAGLLQIRVEGFSGMQWGASFVSSFSIPLAGVLAISILETTFSKKFFSNNDWNATWILGALASLVLYPSALGLGRMDIYSWGWSFYAFPAAIALIAIILFWKKNRCGFLLLLSLASFYLHLQGATNFWDYLIDPFYGILSMIFVLKRIIQPKNGNGSW